MHEFLSKDKETRETQRLKLFENMPEHLDLHKAVFDIAVETFNDALIDHPNNIYVSCERRLHHSQGNDLTNSNLWIDVVKICDPDENIPCRDGVPWKWVCNTCLTFLKNKKLPKLFCVVLLRCLATFTKLLGKILTVVLTPSSLLPA